MFKGKVYLITWIDDCAGEDDERHFPSRAKAEKFWTELTPDLFGSATMYSWRVASGYTPKELFFAALNGRGWAAEGSMEILKEGSFAFKRERIDDYDYTPDWMIEEEE